MTLRLDKQNWELKDSLSGGQGGFGNVFNAVDEQGNAVVAKLVDAVPGARRELLVADSLTIANCQNVIPVLDSGEHEGRLVIIMPKAETSLDQYVARSDGPLSPTETIQILTDIAVALAEINGTVVHRDLKPANVLFYDGAWCLADFGIARYADADTASDTRKGYLSKPYAAPEQWRLEHSTSAADIYAFGVIAYELLTGELPFPGPDYRQQHLTATPPALGSGTLRLRALIEECLWKPPTLRPTPKMLLARLGAAADEPMSPGVSKLAKSNQMETERLARDHAEAVRLLEEESSQAEMFDVAQHSFKAISDALLSAIQDNAPVATISRDAGRGTMLFTATLRYGKVGVSAPLRSPNWTGPFTVIAHANVAVTMAASRQGTFQGRSHSLWFCDAQEEKRFGWYELAFMDSPIILSSTPLTPFARHPNDAAVAFSGAIGSMQLGWPVQELDRIDPSQFVDRWIGWFADAINGGLRKPSTMPELPTQNTWRRG